IPFLVQAQGQPQPFKHANTIIIQPNDSAEMVFENAIAAMVKNGFSVAYADKGAGIINSNSKPVKSENSRISMFLENGRVILSGTFTTNYTTSEMPITYRGMKKSSFMDTWLLMQKVADSYPNATLMYDKR